MDMDAEIPRWVRRMLLVAVLSEFVGFILLFLYAYWKARVPDRVSQAPDCKHEIVLREVSPAWYIDRNFILVVRDLDNGQREKEIFRSPDEGRPIGTERFYWSTDSAHVLLSGKHFIAVGSTDMKLEDDADPYLLYRVADGKLWFAGERLSSDSLSREQLQEIDFGGAVRFKESGGE